MNIFMILMVCFGAAAFFVVYSSVSGWIRAAGIIGVALSALLAFTLVDEYLGKPVEVNSLPNKIIVYGQKIERNESISILYSEDDEIPRYVTLPYSEKMHKGLVEGAREADGQPFQLTLKQTGEEGSEGSGRPGEQENSGSDVGGSISLDSDYDIEHKLPKPILPKKNEEH